MPRCTQRRNGFKHYRWLELGVLPLASAVMRVSWLTPLIHLVFTIPAVAPLPTPFPSWLILALLLGASLLSHVLGLRPSGRAALSLAGLMAITLVLGYLFGFDASAPGDWFLRQYGALADLQMGVPANLVVILITAGLWYGGISIDWAESSTLWQSFLIGVLVLSGMLLFDLGSLEGMAGVDLRAATLIFLVSGMLAMALTSASEMLTLQRARGRAAPFLNRYWLVSAGSVVVAILVAGWLFTQIVSPRAAADTLRAVGGLLGALLNLVIEGIAWIAYAILWALWPLIMALRDLLFAGALGGAEVAELPESSFNELMIEPRAILPALQDILRVVVALSLLAGLALAFYLAERRRRRRQVEVAERRESILSVGLLRAQWEDWQRRRRRGAPARFLSLEGEEAPRRAVREAYQRMLARAEALGLGRSPGETALAHERHLARNLPAAGDDLRVLADAYQVARYSPAPPTPEQVEAARQAWQRLDAALGDRSALRGS